MYEVPDKDHYAHTASFRDVILAEQQGTVAGLKMDNISFGYSFS
jgi:hypothetical protein